MFHDWWMAHRFELMLDAVFAFVALVAILAIGAWVCIARMILKRRKK